MPRTAPAPNIPAIPGMNPGIIVAGGGGSGGGGGAGKGGGKGGKKGAGGNSGEEEPGDGEKSGEDCGTGSPGGCTNCGSVISRGDPVNVATGEVFTAPTKDLALPGFFDFELNRTYSTGTLERDCGLGPGWAHSLNWELRVQRRELVVRNGMRQRVTFPRLDVPGQRAASGGWAIMRTADGFRLRPGNEFFHLFEADPAVPGCYRLTAVTYRERGAIRLKYDEQGRLSHVTDTAGRVIRFEHGSNGKLASVRVPSLDGSAITFATYEYDSAGNLARVTDADGFSTTYRYDAGHRLVEQRYATGLAFFFRYDSVGRCVESWGDYPGMQDAALAEDVPAVLADGETAAKGIHHIRIDYDEDGTSTAYDSVRMQRYFAEDGKISKAVNGLGGVTTRTSDEEGRTVEKIDPLGRRTTYGHDELGKVIEEDHEGMSTSVTRDAEGRPILVTDAGGGVAEYHRNSAGELVLVRDQAGNVWRRVLDARGRVVELVDPNGGRTRYEYDSQGNLIQRTDPDARTHHFAYDYWGRRLSQVDEDGSRGQWIYTDAGRLIAFIDPLGRRKSVEYDALGKIIRVTTPDGLTTLIERGGYGWPTRVTFPDRTEQRCLYNREGWPMVLINEHGERQVVQRDAEGMIVHQVTFDGRDRRVGYDLRCNQQWFDEGFGRFEFERNATDQLTSVVAPDGTTRQLEYNQRRELTLARQDDVSVRWARDAVGAIVEEIAEIEGRTYSIRNQFNGVGKRVGFTSSVGIEAAVRRDLNGRVSAIHVDGKFAVSVTFGSTGDPETWSLASGGAIDEHYDGARRLTHRRVRPFGAAFAPAIHAGDAGLNSAGTVATDGTLDTVEKYFEYNAVNEIEQRTTGEAKVAYSYDLRRHLIERSAVGQDELYRADATGNYYHRLGDEAPERRYGTGNRLERDGNTHYEYDQAGRLIRKRVGSVLDEPEQVTDYEWSAFGLLSAVDTPRHRVEFRYDSFARRVVKRVHEKTPEGLRLTTHLHFIWDAQSLLAEVDVSGDEPRVIRSYLYEENKRSLPLAQRDHARDGTPGEWVYFVGDQNGTPEELVNGAGQIVGRLERTSFGRVTHASGLTTAFRFPGQYADEETGLFYNRYRYYDPNIGRYISADPRDTAGGFNHYAYGPNPIGWFDPMGWMHSMMVEGVSGFEGGDLAEGDFFNSGFSGLKNDEGDCPEHLQSQARSHSERKFDEVVRQAHENGRITHPAQVALRGELPPCRNCHRTMQKLADETGVTVQYNYGSESVTYSGSGDGSPGTTTFSDSALGQGYAMTPIPENASGYTYRFDNWSSAGTAYSTASGGE